MRAEKGHLVGFQGLHGHIYHAYHPSTGRVVRARDVKFNEHHPTVPELDTEFQAQLSEVFSTDDSVLFSAVSEKNLSSLFQTIQIRERAQRVLSHIWFLDLLWAFMDIYTTYT
ncbi:hypothetical protein CDD82_2525 [Ophiocordyceps australis]|uniref:Retroviral polymerase SH3-like domain-containing protein n=1 Tax=Ophiocordyceps australis TaxID=1399860 RepID=A0A2C5ZDY3_9HYPO|nr:hypothetical protein CDD82_2525 [Ophiocordyceps australis]